MTKDELEQLKARINFTLCAQGITIVVRKFVLTKAAAQVSVQKKEEERRVGP